MTSYNGIMEIEEAVGRDPEIMSGELCFRGTRVPVRNLFDDLEAGESLEAFHEGFPRVTREQVDAVLRSSYQNLVRSLDERIAA